MPRNHRIMADVVQGVLVATYQDVGSFRRRKQQDGCRG